MQARFYRESTMGKPLLELTEQGYYCARADVYIDPWRRVQRAIVTHAHADHARPGMGQYLAHRDSEQVLRLRLGASISLQTLNYREPIFMNGVEITLFPAGHVPGSAQVRLAYKGEVWVISGDYKLEDDGLSPAFEPLACQHFITESTFGLPVYRWRPQQEILSEINAWWKGLADSGENAVVSAYSLGKAQRVLRLLDRSIGPVYCHSAVAQTNRALEAQGFDFGLWQTLSEAPKEKVQGAILIAPPAAVGSAALRKWGDYQTGQCSGWMALRGQRRWSNLDRGFVLSDHADWTGLCRAVEATGAENVYVTHGYSAVFARYLREEKGLNAQTVKTMFSGDDAAEDLDKSLMMQAEKTGGES
ncbi:MAG: ligase-associated DNA damage response exonuclease [Bacteroidia bacterium]